MYVINARNVHEALPAAVRLIYREGYRRDSRNGDVIVAPAPVTTVYRYPSEMCTYWPQRNVNPFATLFEGLWMLAGRNDVAYLTQFIKRFADFSDDGETLHGAYGERWRHRFDVDQLEHIGEELSRRPDCRRQILQIWDARTDLVDPGKDVPCNTVVHFQINHLGELDMSVFNRSNDLVWGTYGADAPHFGMLLQYMAHRVGADVGRYWQISDNWHAYVKTLDPINSLQHLARDPFHHNECIPSPYRTGVVQPLDMMFGVGEVEAWDADLAMFMEEEERAIGYRTYFFKKVACPLRAAHRAYKELEGRERYDEAIKILGGCRADDWRKMGELWLRTLKEKNRA